MPTRRARACGAVTAWLLSIALASADTGVPDTLDPDVIDALRRGEAVVLMRHALAPGTGDPANFTRGDCDTQRNLSDAGRAQARAIGERLRALLDGQPAEVYSSAWCRCLDTARLLDVGPVEPLPALDSFFRERDARGARTEALERWIEARLADVPADAPADGIAERADDERAERPAARPTAVLVTHQVNVTALSGAFVASGEMLVVDRRDGVRVLASIETVAPSEPVR